MTNYNVTLTAAENLALGHVAFSQQEWIDNAVHERCRVAIEDIVKICVEKCLETDTQIPSSKDAMVMLAFERGWVKSGADRAVENANANNQI